MFILDQDETVNLVYFTPDPVEGRILKVLNKASADRLRLAELGADPWMRPRKPIEIGKNRRKSAAGFRADFRYCKAWLGCRPPLGRRGQAKLR